jgi:hypothetical protein
MLSTSPAGTEPAGGDAYFVSLWDVCFRQKRQYFRNSSLPVVVFRFFVVT